jgi:hypothetical protein
MTKQQLIDSYPSPGPLWLIILILILIVGGLVVMFLSVHGEENNPAGFDVAKFSVGAALILGGALFIYLGADIRENRISTWHNTTFKSYLKEQSKVEVPMKDYTLNADGTITILAKGENGPITFPKVSDIKPTTEESYVAYVPVKGLESIDISDRAEQVTFYLNDSSAR